jgi:peptidoglycan/LPS O-acetylase OafA/YrhL
LIYRTFAAFYDFSIISTYCLTPSCLDSLAMGALIAVTNSGRSKHRSPVDRSLERRLLLAGTVAVIVVRALNYWQFRKADVILFDLALAIFFGGIIKAAARGLGGSLGVFLQWRPLCFLGKISYGIYVYHVFLPGLFSKMYNDLVLRGVLDENHWPSSRMSGWVVLLSVPIPILSWYLLEQPINRLKDSLAHDPSNLNPGPVRLTGPPGRSRELTKPIPGAIRYRA